MISVDPLKENNILYLKVLSDEIDFDPEYQRDSDIWPLSKKQLFIDSLINGIDIPKLYFHEVKKTKSYPYRYAVVDGKQRLEAIFSFIDDEFPLAEDMVDFSGEYKNLEGKKYSNFSDVSLKFKASFDAKQLPIYIIKTDDQDLIDEMFYRLNEAAPLNAAEKRNSFGGPYPKLVRELVNHTFFQTSIKFTARRFKHHDAVGKILLLLFNDKIEDTKKVHLDNFAKRLKKVDKEEIAKLKKDANQIFNFWQTVFCNNDNLLKSPSVLPVYLDVYRKLQESSLLNLFQRDVIQEFEDLKQKNRQVAKEDEENDKINYSWLEYDRLVQSPNDSSSIKFRSNLLLDYITSKAGIKLKKI